MALILGKALREKREAVGITAAALGEIAGVDGSTICKWELEQVRVPRIASYNKVMAALKALENRACAPKTIPAPAPVAEAEPEAKQVTFEDVAIRHICKVCGRSTMGTEAKFCKHCGTPLRSAEERANRSYAAVQTLRTMLLLHKKVSNEYVDRTLSEVLSLLTLIVDQAKSDYTK